MQDQGPLQEYAETCENDLLKRIIEVYAQHKHESRDAIASCLTTSFGTILEERLNARSEDRVDQT
jgi:hypothetical protein